MRSSLGPGSGSGPLRTSSTSGPPCRRIQIARMTGADLPLLACKVKTCPGFVCGLLLLPAECAARLQAIDQHGTVIKDLWYKNAVIYCLNVATFLDSNGDGIGDFEGLVRRLDYIAGLGVNAIWLHPFQKSPRRDDGYDISDFYQVDPVYGTLGDFVEFTHEAKQRGIRVIIDLVVNHTSDQHPWFKQARKNERSKYRHYYLWSKKRPKDYDEGMVFP